MRLISIAFQETDGVYQGIDSTARSKFHFSRLIFHLSRVRHGSPEATSFAGVRENAALVIARINAGIVKVSLTVLNSDFCKLKAQFSFGTRGRRVVKLHRSRIITVYADT